MVCPSSSSFSAEDMKPMSTNSKSPGASTSYIKSAPAPSVSRTVMRGAPTTTSPSPSPSRSPTSSAAPNSDPAQPEMFLVVPQVNDVTSASGGSDDSEQPVCVVGTSLASSAAL